MLSVAIHKDIAEYQPKVIGKLTGRTLISITVALGLSVAVAVYMNLVLKIDPTDHLEFIYAVSLPCWCCGFWKPHGLPFEQFALLWLTEFFLVDLQVPLIASWAVISTQKSIKLPSTRTCPCSARSSRSFRMPSRVDINVWMSSMPDRYR